MNQERHEKSQTKIVATIGPASSSKEILRQLFFEGIDVCRLNFSHGRHEDHGKIISNVLELNQELNSNVAILADLQGPKIRIGQVENNEIELLEGQEIELTTREIIGTSSKIFISYRELPQDIEVGEPILMDDGKIELQVTRTDRKENVTARVLHGGILSSKKGVNLPRTKISVPSLTPKDLADADFALDHDVDWIALSFVRSASDILDLKKIIKDKGKHTKVIAKIEKPEALDDIDNIIDVSDGIMVARGDLGVEVSFDKVPVIQKKLVDKSIQKAKPVIIATQMMESMINNFRPTRAEANDVANAVLDGADALMLSAETATGKYPVEVIRSMQRIVDWTENNGFVYNRIHDPLEPSENFLPDSICANASNIARITKAQAIVVLTHSGYTAFRISSHRPNAEIFAYTPNKGLLRQMSLLWGVRAFHFQFFKDINLVLKESANFLKEKRLSKQGDKIIHVASLPLNEQGKTNMIRIGIV